MANNDSKRSEGDQKLQSGTGQPVPDSTAIDELPTNVGIPVARDISASDTAAIDELPTNVEFPAAPADIATSDTAAIDKLPTNLEVPAVSQAASVASDTPTEQYTQPTPENLPTLPEHSALTAQQPRTPTAPSRTSLVKMEEAPKIEPAPKPQGHPVIVTRNLTKTYVLGRGTAVQALRGVNLEVYPGEFVAIMGPSGSGKSTFMNMLGCLDRPTVGEYWLSGKIVSKMSNDELAGIRNQLLGFVFQGFNLLGRATALNNVALPMIYAGIPRKERERRARKVLQLVGLGGRIYHKPSELSGGQQQRVAIARSLINGPALLLADEPTGNLDSRTSVEIMGVLQALNEQGLTVVLVTHDMKIAQYAKRQVSFLDGRVVRDEPVLAPRSAQDEWLALQSEVANENGQSAYSPQATQVKEEKP